MNGSVGLLLAPTLRVPMVAGLATKTGRDLISWRDFF